MIKVGLGMFTALFRHEGCGGLANTDLHAG